MFKPVPSRVNFPSMERDILQFWKDRDIFHRTESEREGKPIFTLYEGPPTANGSPGIHHVLARVFKDVIPRYKTMKGFRCVRKGGWDTHGLPVELEIEKELGLKSKRDIEEYGIEQFNRKCRESVFRYVKEWEDMTDRIGFWVDMEHPYITLDNEYVETGWWILRQLWDKGLLYKDIKGTPHCPRCVTSLSSHEVALGYQENTEDPSIFVKFPLSEPLAAPPGSASGRKQRTHLLSGLDHHSLDAPRQHRPGRGRGCRLLRYRGRGRKWTGAPDYGLRPRGTHHQGVPPRGGYAQGVQPGGPHLSEAVRPQGVRGGHALFRAKRRARHGKGDQPWDCPGVHAEGGWRRLRIPRRWYWHRAYRPRLRRRGPGGRQGARPGLCTVCGPPGAGHRSYPSPESSSRTPMGTSSPTSKRGACSITATCTATPTPSAGAAMRPAVLRQDLLVHPHHSR